MGAIFGLLAGDNKGRGNRGHGRSVVGFMRVLLAAIAVACILPAMAQDVALPRPRPEVTGATPAPAPVTSETLPPAAAPEPAEAPVPVPPAEAPERAEDASSPETPEAPPVPLPRHRPPAQPGEKAETPAVETKPPEEPKEPRIYQTACPAVLSGQVEAKALPPIAENQCMVQSPLSLTGVLVNGRMIEVTGGVVTDCSVATVLPQWASAIDGYLWAHENGRLKAIIVGTSFMCRPRNNVVGADISEHGFADALDVVGFKLEDGRTVTVEGGWSDALSNDGRLLRFAHDSACSLFTTTLGPEANALHHDHLHVDLGCHGSRCTAQMCE
jgi:hypothetical protein